MTKETLIERGKTLKTLSKNVLEELNTKEALILEELNKKMLRRKDVVEMVGETNIDMMKDNHANHLRFMCSIFMEYQNEVFIDTIIWVFKAYRSRGFKSTYWSAQLNSWTEVYKEQLSEQAFQEINPFYQFIIINIPHFTLLSEDIDTSVYPEH